MRKSLNLPGRRPRRKSAGSSVALSVAPCLEPQRGLGANHERLRQISSGRQQHGAAAGLAAVVERFLDRLGVERFAVARRTGVAHVEDRFGACATERPAIEAITNKNRKQNAVSWIAA